MFFYFFFLLFSLVCIFRYSDCRCLNWFIISPPFIISSCQFYVSFRYSNDKWRCIVILLSISLTARLVYALLVWLPFGVTWKRKYFFGKKIFLFFLLTFSEQNKLRSDLFFSISFVISVSVWEEELMSCLHSVTCSNRLSLLHLYLLEL